MSCSTGGGAGDSSNAKSITFCICCSLVGVVKLSLLGIYYKGQIMLKTPIGIKNPKSYWIGWFKVKYKNDTQKAVKAADEQILYETRAAKEVRQ